MKNSCSLNKLLSGVAVLLFIFCSSDLLAQGPAGKMTSIINAERKAAENSMMRTATFPNNYDLKYHRFTWSVDPSVYYISGSVTSYFIPTIAGFNLVNFDLMSNMLVDSVVYHGVSNAFTHNSDVLQIPMSGTLPQGVLDSVTVYYQGAPASSGFGSFIKDVHAGSDVIWTLSEPFGAREWWPCKQDLNDKIDSIDVIVTVPTGNRVASNGLLISEVPIGSDVVFHWKSNYPIAAYLVAIAVTNYSYYSNFVPLPNGIDTLEVLNYVYPEDLSLAQALTADIVDVIQLYDTLVEVYPFKDEKYGHAQFSWGGGMEHQTMSYVSDFNHELLAHECAHQWFGDYITCGSWEDIWLNEGFATYMEALTEQYLVPANWYNWRASTSSYITSQPDGSVLCDDTTNVNRIFDGRLTYNKGAYLLHMLRWKVGDQAFFQGLRDYLNDPLLHFGYAKTPDFKNHMELASGQNLTTFFNQWYNGQGYPSYNIDWSYNNGSVFAQINQTTSHPSVSFYQMPVPIYFTNGIKDTTIVFDNTVNGQQFSAPISFIPTLAEFDPELWILSANNQITVGLPENFEQNIVVNLYPNPVQNNLHISLNKAYDNLKIKISDISGRIVKEYMDEGKMEIDINTSSFAKGFYVVQLETNGTQLNKRIIVE